MDKFQEIRKSFRDHSFNHKELKECVWNSRVITLGRVVRNIILHRESTKRKNCWDCEHIMGV